MKHNFFIAGLGISEARLIGFGKYENAPNMPRAAESAKAAHEIRSNSDLYKNLVQARDQLVTRPEFSFIREEFHRDMFFAVLTNKLVTNNKPREPNSPDYSQRTFDPAFQLEVLKIAEEYKKANDRLLQLLTAGGIGFSVTEREMDHIEGKTLTRNEYFMLLMMEYDGKHADVQKMVTGKDVKAIRSALPGQRGPLERRLNIYTDLSADELPPETAGNRFNIVVGQQLLNDYMAFRQGRARSGMPPESAVSWAGDPARALEFLDKSMASTPANREFLYAVRYHLVVKDPAGRLELEATRGKPKMDARDAQAALELVVQNLVQSEQVVTNSLNEKRMLSKQGLDKTLEKAGGDAWEYIKNFQDHPVMSLIAVGVAYVAIRKVWKFINKDEWNKYEDLAAIGVGGFLFHLYQKHTTGTSYVDWFKEKFKNVLPFDPSLPKEQQTLANYWAPKLGDDREFQRPQVNEAMRGKCLSVLQPQNAKQTMDWYDKMEQWRNRGGNAAEQPPMPFIIQNRADIFGESRGSKEIGSLMFESLHNFFYHVGETRDAQNAFGSRTFRGNADRGVAFVRARFGQSADREVADATKEPYYKDVVEVEVGGRRVKINLLNPNDPNLLILQQSNPEIYKQLMIGRSVMRRYDFAKIEMWNIFLMMADPKGLAAMDSNLGGLVEEILNDTTTGPGPGAPPPGPPGPGGPPPPGAGGGGGGPPPGPGGPPPGPPGPGGP